MGIWLRYCEEAGELWRHMGIKAIWNGIYVILYLQGHSGWTLAQPGLVEGVLAHGKLWNEVIIEVSSNPNSSMSL